MIKNLETYLNPIHNDTNPFLLVSEMQTLCSGAREANNTDHVHEFFTIYFLKSGDVKYVTAHIKDTIQSPGLLFIGPGIMHRMVIPESVQGYTVIFNDAFIQLESSTFFKELHFFSEDQIYSLLPLKTEVSLEFEHLITMMQKEHHGAINGNGLLLKNYLNVLLLKAQNYQKESPLHSGNGIPSDHHCTLVKFRTMVNEQYKSTRQVSDYAQQLNIQPECLNEITKNLSGVTASELIRNKILNAARQLLYTTTLSFKEIGWQLGFEDAAYFSRYFKKHTGQTLKQFKQQMLNVSK